MLLPPHRPPTSQGFPGFGRRGAPAIVSSGDSERSSHLGAFERLSLSNGGRTDSASSFGPPFTGSGGGAAAGGAQVFSLGADSSVLSVFFKASGTIPDRCMPAEHGYYEVRGGPASSSVARESAAAAPPKVPSARTSERPSSARPGMPPSGRRHQPPPEPPLAEMPVCLILHSTPPQVEALRAQPCLKLSQLPSARPPSARAGATTAASFADLIDGEVLGELPGPSPSRAPAPGSALAAIMDEEGG